MYLDWYYFIGAIHWIVCVKFADSFERDLGCGKRLGRIIRNRTMVKSTQNTQAHPEVPTYMEDTRNISPYHKDSDIQKRTEGIVNYLLLQYYRRMKGSTNKRSLHSLRSSKPLLRQQLLSRRKRAFGNPSLPRKKSRRKKPPPEPQKKES